jgi:hypothetical protein
MKGILVATSLEGYDRLRTILRDVDAAYTTSYAGAIEALMQGEYSDIVVDLQFAEARILEFARNVKEQQPSAHLVCVNVTGGPSNSGIEESLRMLGYQGVVDLTRRWKDQDRRQAGRDRRAHRRSTGVPDRRRATAQTIR